VLELNKVTFRYKDGCVAVQDTSLTIEQGNFIAIAGRNGSGKTTLTKLIMSLLKPTAGVIQFRGQDTRNCTPADMARSIGYVFQNPDRQIFRDTVAAEVAYGPEQLGFSPDKIKENVEKALQTVGLEQLATAYPKGITKSQKQKVAIASALAMDPHVLILDEPTSGQDAQASKNLMELLKTLNAAGVTIILVTHNMELLARYAQRVVIMDKGTKAFDGPTCELFGRQRDVASWGLREPATTVISRRLGEYGVEVTTAPGELAASLSVLLGGKVHA
jgi:energy-coupling factor transport system ATP-binding protein